MCVMASEMFLSQATSTDRLGKVGSPTTLCGVGWRCGNSTLHFGSSRVPLGKFGERPKRSGNRSAGKERDMRS